MAERRNCAGCGVQLNGHEEDYCCGCVAENQYNSNADNVDGYDRDDLGESPDW